jgi:hypothetical protein
MDELDPRTLFWAAAVLFLVFAAFAARTERRRAERANLDEPGLMPWHLLQVLAFILSAAAAALALKG